jgi:DNA invertase Pin-like site-specific DNA recombinase
LVNGGNNALVAKTARKSEKATGVVGYCRVLAQENSTLALSLKDQEKAIRKECTKRGFDLVALYSDAGLPETHGRPALSAALASLNDGNGAVLMVTKLDRLTRSMHVAARVLASAERGGWGIIALDSPVDTTTTEGSSLIQILAIFDEMERKLIGEREARPEQLSVRRPPARLGRPSTLSLDIVERIVEARKGGATWAAIADELNEEGVPTAQGGKQWYPATVRHVANAAEARQ